MNYLLGKIIQDEKMHLWETNKRSQYASWK